MKTSYSGQEAASICDHVAKVGASASVAASCFEQGKTLADMRAVMPLPSPNAAHATAPGAAVAQTFTDAAVSREAFAHRRRPRGDA